MNAPAPPSRPSPPSTPFPTLAATFENIQPAGTNSAGGPACVAIALRVDDTGSAPISSAQLHLVFTEPHKTLTANAPVKVLNLPGGGLSALSFSSCGLGLSTFTYTVSGAITYWSPARPGETGAITLPTTSSSSF